MWSGEVFTVNPWLPIPCSYTFRFLCGYRKLLTNSRGIYFYLMQLMHSGKDRCITLFLSTPAWVQYFHEQRCDFRWGGGGDPILRAIGHRETFRALKWPLCHRQILTKNGAMRGKLGVFSSPIVWNGLNWAEFPIIWGRKQENTQIFSFFGLIFLGPGLFSPLP